MRRQTFLFLSTTDWDAPQFGSRQQIALQLARRGHRVLFVEIPRALHGQISAGLIRGPIDASILGLWIIGYSQVAPSKDQRRDKQRRPTFHTEHDNQ